MSKSKIKTIKGNGGTPDGRHQGLDPQPDLAAKVARLQTRLERLERHILRVSGDMCEVQENMLGVLRLIDARDSRYTHMFVLGKR